MKKQLIGLGVAALMFSGSANATLYSTTFEVTDDRTIGDSNTDGTPDYLATQEDGYLRTGFYSTLWRSAIEFNLFDLTDGTYEIDSAFLYITDKGSAKSGDLNIWGYDGNGVIELMDALETNYLVGQITIDAAQYNPVTYAIDVTDFLNTLTISQSQYAGFLIGADTPTGLDGAASDIVSADTDTYGFDRGLRPHLDVVYNDDIQPVPEPATMLLFGTGLVGLAGSRIRKKKQQ